jgi:rhomboid protease GluP
MLCPNCGKLISISSPSCPFCGAAKPGLWGFGPALSRVFAGGLDPVRVIPMVCLGLYVLALAIDLRAVFDFSGGIFGILSPSSRALRILGLTAPVDLVLGGYWTLLTAIYLHGGVLHILFNLMWIRSLAPEVQRAFGPARFFILWSLAGAFGFLLSDLTTSPGSIGASGSIFGLMAALIVYGRATGASLLTRQIWQWAIIIGIMGFLLPGVDNMAHLGGFAAGWLVATFFRGSIGKPDGRATTLLALAFIVLTALGFVLNVGQALAFFMSRS